MTEYRDKAIYHFTTNDGLLHAAIDCSSVVGFTLIKDCGRSKVDMLAERRLKAEIRYFESMDRGEKWKQDDDLDE